MGIVDKSWFVHARERSARVTRPPKILADLLRPAGVRFNGQAPWDIRVNNPVLYREILSRGSLGFGEAYMDGAWDCYQMDELFHRLLSADVDRAVQRLSRTRLLFSILRHRLFNLQNEFRARQVGEQHYDIGNDVFEAMLDPTMSYSCGYWADAKDLQQAQRDKLDLVCRKLELREGEHLLDIGCGWGGMARFAAENYGVRVTGITISREQLKLAQQRCAGLPVKLELCDYRKLEGSFDKIVSIGMFEHVGPKNYRSYFETANRLLNPEGLFLLHTIGHHRTVHTTDRWIDKYIFPNGKLPSVREISETMEGIFIVEDWHNFGRDYDRTLMAWWRNFDAAWPSLKASYSERFYRMFKYYLMCCAGLFRSRQGMLWQLVLSKRYRLDQYRSVR